MFFSALLALTLVQPLPFPQYATVGDLGGDQNPISVGASSVAVDVVIAREYGGLVYWRGPQRIPLPKWQDAEIPNPAGEPFFSLGAVRPNGTLYAEDNISRSCECPFHRGKTDILRLRDGFWSQVDLGSCGIDTDSYTPHLYKVESDGALDLTFYYTYIIDNDDIGKGVYAPVAMRLSGGRCTKLGDFELRDAANGYAVGFRGYLDGGLGPTIHNNPDAQRIVAVRVYDGTLKQLGRGEALAVAPDGFTVGADGPTFDLHMGIYDQGPWCCPHHPVAWDSRGREIPLAPQAKSGVAYAVDSTHRVIGMLVGRDGRHYAFLWQDGKLHLLDETVQAPGWRFEGAYRFTDDGAIVGVGTYNGIATGFVLRS